MLGSNAVFLVASTYSWRENIAVHELWHCDWFALSFLIWFCLCVFVFCLTFRIQSSNFNMVHELINEGLVVCQFAQMIFESLFDANIGHNKRMHSLHGNITKSQMPYGYSFKFFHKWRNTRHQTFVEHCKARNTSNHWQDLKSHSKFEDAGNTSMPVKECAETAIPRSH